MAPIQIDARIDASCQRDTCAENSTSATVEIEDATAPAIVTHMSFWRQCPHFPRYVVVLLQVSPTATRRGSKCIMTSAQEIFQSQYNKENVCRWMERVQEQFSVSSRLSTQNEPEAPTEREVVPRAPGARASGCPYTAFFAPQSFHSFLLSKIVSLKFSTTRSITSCQGTLSQHHNVLMTLYCEDCAPKVSDRRTSSGDARLRAALWLVLAAPRRCAS